MSTILNKRRTWKRAPIKKPSSLIKENSHQKIEKIIHEGKTALCITYKTNITLKDLSFIKSATSYLCENDLPFSNLLSFHHTNKGYQGIWGFRPGKVKPFWAKEEYQALGHFLGKMHSIAKGYKSSCLYKPPVVLALRESYETIKNYLPESFDTISPLLKTLEDRWPIYLDTGLVHTDLFPKNILFKHSEVTGILQNHSMQNDILLYDLTSIIKSIYFSNFNVLKENEDAFFSSYTSYVPLTDADYKSIPILTSAKLLRTCFSLIERHFADKENKDTHLNAAVIALIHAEKALHIYH